METKKDKSNVKKKKVNEKKRKENTLYKKSLQLKVIWLNKE